MRTDSATYGTTEVARSTIARRRSALVYGARGSRQNGRPGRSSPVAGTAFAASSTLARQSELSTEPMTPIPLLAPVPVPRGHRETVAFEAVCPGALHAHEGVGAPTLPSPGGRPGLRGRARLLGAQERQ